jgi:transketolase
VLGLEPLPAKFAAFGFATHECDGHDCDALTSAFEDLLRARGKPGALVARTTKGHGVSFMADDNRWHYTRLNEETYARALEELT